MTATAQGTWAEQADDPDVQLDSRVDPAREDAYWQSVYWGEPYYRTEHDYEDYAPAYCVGYVGFAQYGGSFADAEKSLCANWLRIKGGSRLGPEEALWAIRAAWLHAEQSAHAPQPVDEEEEDIVIEVALPMADGAGRSSRHPSRRPALVTA